jgi:hypothetical protein
MDPGWHDRLERDGFAELPGVFDAAAVDAITRELTAALAGASPTGPPSAPRAGSCTPPGTS